MYDSILTYKYKILFFNIHFIKKYKHWFFITDDYLFKLFSNNRVHDIQVYIDSYYTRNAIVENARAKYKTKLRGGLDE